MSLVLLRGPTFEESESFLQIYSDILNILESKYAFQTIVG